MSSPADAHHDPTIGQLLAQVSRLVGGRMRVKMEAFGLHRAQAFILFQLWHQDGIAQNELARALRIRPATVTNTLQRMERTGWIERRRDQADQRMIRVFLTDKARAFHQEIRRSIREMDAELTSTLSADERRILRGSLLKVRHHLAGDDEHPTGPEPTTDATGRDTGETGR